MKRCLMLSILVLVLAVPGLSNRVSAAVAARASALPAIAPAPRSAARATGETDERTRVTNTSEAPWMYMCKIDVNYGENVASGGWFRTSGFLVSPHAVLTAAHNLHCPGQMLAGAASPTRYWIESALITLAQDEKEDGSLTCLAQSYAEHAYVSDLYRTGRDGLAVPDTDYGVLLCREPFPDWGALALDCNSMDLDPQLPVESAGYPLNPHGEPSSGLWLSPGVLTFFERRTEYYDQYGTFFRLDMDAGWGQCGSPIMKRYPSESSPRYKAIGLLSYVSDEGARTPWVMGPRFGPANRKQIQEWIDWRPGSPLPGHFKRRDGSRELLVPADRTARVPVRCGDMFPVPLEPNPPPVENLCFPVGEPFEYKTSQARPVELVISKTPEEFDGRHYLHLLYSGPHGAQGVAPRRFAARFDDAWVPVGIENQAPRTFGDKFTLKHARAANGEITWTFDHKMELGERCGLWEVRGTTWTMEKMLWPVP